MLCKFLCSCLYNITSEKSGFAKVIKGFIENSGLEKSLVLVSLLKVGYCFIFALIRRNLLYLNCHQ